jgi:hypothetical protein
MSGEMIQRNLSAHRLYTPKETKVSGGDDGNVMARDVPR